MSNMYSSLNYSVKIQSHYNKLSASHTQKYNASRHPNKQWNIAEAFGINKQIRRGSKENFPNSAYAHYVKMRVLNKSITSLNNLSQKVKIKKRTCIYSLPEKGGISQIQYFHVTV